MAASSAAWQFGDGDAGAFEAPALSDRDLAAIIKLVYDKSGITLHDGKRALITARLHKRLKAVGAASFRAYLDHIERDRSGSELVLLLDAISTNHTSFYREPQHFELLRTKVVPEWQAKPGAPDFSVWSAACSSGEEPYTIGMVLSDALPAAQFGQVKILASDLSTRVLQQGQQGIYKMDRVKDLPLEILRRHFEKGRGEHEGYARVRADLRSKVEYRQLNLLEITDLRQRFAVVFCRNVMIYFDRDVQQRVVTMLERHIAPGGYLFISHSESLNGVRHGLKWIAPAVYRRVA